MSLPITDEVSAHVGPDLRGVLLGLVEVYQRQERWEDAIACLERLKQLEPDDVVVKLFLAELLLTARRRSRSELETLYAEAPAERAPSDVAVSAMPGRRATSIVVRPVRVLEQGEVCARAKAIALGPDDRSGCDGTNRRTV